LQVKEIFTGKHRVHNQIYQMKASVAGKGNFHRKAQGA
jgi:hypothetical protein